jgi:hypothetical protein
VDLAISKQGDQWDLVFADGDLVLTRPLGQQPTAQQILADVGQRVTYRLMTWLAESGFDRSVGLPYLDGIFGDEPVGAVTFLLVQEARTTPGVQEVVGTPEFTLDDRTLRLSMVLKIRNELLPLDLEVTP